MDVHTPRPGYFKMTNNTKSPQPAYRQVEVRYILDRLNAGDSCSIVGVSGSAKSNLFRHLLNHEVRQGYWGTAWNNYLFIPVDSNALEEISESAMYGLLLNRLMEEARTLAWANLPSDQTDALSEEVAKLKDATLWQSTFSRAVKSMLAEPSRHLIFLFDQFDELYRKLNPRFFVNLRSIRDTYKHRISYVTFSRHELLRLCSSPECEEFYELLQSTVLGLGPYDHDDAWFEIRSIASRYGVLPKRTDCEILFRVTGGHAGLLKAAYMGVLQREMKLPQRDEDVLTVLLGMSEVIVECAKLWKSLEEDEQQEIRVVAQDIILMQTSDVQQRLFLKRIINHEKKLFCPLFARYISEFHVALPVETRMQCGPVRVDAADEVWVQGQRLEPSLTVSELRLLIYLCSRAGQVCTKDEIIIDVHREKYGKGETVSDEAIAALVERLRKRIEPDPSRPKFILTIRGKGYMLKI